MGLSLQPAGPLHLSFQPFHPSPCQLRASHCQSPPSAPFKIKPIRRSFPSLKPDLRSYISKYWSQEEGNFGSSSQPFISQKESPLHTHS